MDGVSSSDSICVKGRDDDKQLRGGGWDFYMVGADNLLYRSNKEFDEN